MYQLAHELAHVNMGAQVDRYLIKTFATAVSLEILEQMGMNAYADRCRGAAAARGR